MHEIWKWKLLVQRENRTSMLHHLRLFDFVYTINLKKMVYNYVYIYIIYMYIPDGADPSAAEPTPRKRPLYPPLLKNPALLWALVLMLSMGNKTISVAMPAALPA